MTAARRLQIVAVCTALALPPLHAAAAPLRYACSTTLTYGPSGCSGSIPSNSQSTLIEIDLEQKTWKLSGGESAGTAEADGGGIVLRQWGGMKNRDARIDRLSGTFSYRYQSSCLLEIETGTCKQQ